jgi:hypothetical protein
LQAQRAVRYRFRPGVPETVDSAPGEDRRPLDFISRLSVLPYASATQPGAAGTTGRLAFWTHPAYTTSTTLVGSASPTIQIRLMRRPFTSRSSGWSSNARMCPDMPTANVDEIQTHAKLSPVGS